MARAKGRDVLIELMDSVAQIQATTARHADLLETLAAQAVSIAHRVQSLEREVHELARGFVQSAELSRTLQLQVGRMARTLGDFAGGSATRLKTIEERLDRLERKAG